MRVVLANGVFDLLHPGHIAHLKQARAMGDRLVVSLTIDGAVGKGNGRPVFTWEERAALLRELRCVSEVIPSASGHEAIAQVRPNVFVKGIDYQKKGLRKEEIEACSRVGAQILFTNSPKMGTSAVIERIKCAS